MDPVDGTSGAHAFQESPADPADRQVAILEQHTACMACEYDLHGLPTRGKCPECGCPIADTLEAHRNNQSWLVAIGSGAHSMLIGHYTLLASIVLLPLFPLGICFFVLLMEGGAVELGSPSSSAMLRSNRDRQPMLLIGSSMIACVAALFFLTMPAVAIPLAAMAFLLFQFGLIRLWRLYARVMALGLSLRAARLGVILSRIHVATTATTLLTLFVVLLARRGMSVALLGKLVSGSACIAWLIAIVASIVALHLGQAGLYRALSSLKAEESA